MRINQLLPIVAVVTLSATAFAEQASAGQGAAYARAQATIARLDPDKDGSLDKREIRRGAIAKFKRLNPDRDGTLDAAELRGVLSAKGFAIANPDGDGTISLGEYLRLVKRLYKEVNKDGDRTIEAAELAATPHGRLLRRLID